MCTKESKITENQFKLKAREILNNLGISASLRGYDYIIHILWLKYYNHPGHIKLTYMYGVCGKYFDTSYSKVERGIRYAFSKLDLTSPYYLDIFGDIVDFTNGNLLNLIFHYILENFNNKDEDKEISNYSNSELVRIVKSLEREVNELKNKVSKLEYLCQSINEISIMNERIV